MGKLICGVGIFVDHPIRGLIKTGSKKGPLPVYSTWQSMLARCYNPKHQAYPRYGGAGVTVHKDWHDFQTFARWYENNHIDGWNMDKDLLGWNQYGPSSCVYLPPILNQMLRWKDARGYYKNSSGKFQVKIKTGDIEKRLGCFSTEEEASLVYKRERTLKLQKVLEQYQLSTEIKEAVLKLFP